VSLSSIVREVKRAQTIVSQPYRQWLGQHLDDPLPDWVIERINEQLRAKQRDRRYGFSASSGGQCLRRRELSYLGVSPSLRSSPDARLLNIFHDGRWRHLRWQASLLAAGVIDDIEVVLDWPNMRHRGTMDGAGVVRSNHPFPEWRNKTFGLELKGMNTWHYDKQVRVRDDQMDAHKAQVTEYFLSSGYDLFVFLYEDKKTGGWNEWVVTPDLQMIRDASHNLVTMNADIDSKQLRPMLPSCEIRKGPNWTGCPFGGSHGPCERAGDWPG
jgi:hypothetical protein